MISFTFFKIVSLAFVTRFISNLDYIYQDYFIFDGNGTKAHLFRNGSTLNLVLLSDNIQRYIINDIMSNFTFQWEGYLVNGEAMQLFRSTGKLGKLHFHSYTFNSYDIEDSVRTIEKENKTNKAKQCCTNQTRNQINYWLVFGIVFVVGIMLKTDVIFIAGKNAVCTNKSTTALRETRL